MDTFIAIAILYANVGKETKLASSIKKILFSSNIKFIITERQKSVHFVNHTHTVSLMLYIIVKKKKKKKKKNEKWNIPFYLRRAGAGARRICLRLFL